MGGDPSTSGWGKRQYAAYRGASCPLIAGSAVRCPAPPVHTVKLEPQPLLVVRTVPCSSLALVTPVFSSFVSPAFTPRVLPLSVVRLFALGTGVSSVFLPVFLLPYYWFSFFVSAPSVFVFEWNRLAFCCFYLPDVLHLGPFLNWKCAFCSSSSGS